MKDPRQCLLVLLVKVGWRGGKTFGSEGRDEKWSKEGSYAGFHCTQLRPRVETLNLERAAYGEILILTWERLMRRKIFVLILRGLCESHAVQRGIWLPTQYLL
jgi:hypothetical protein